MSEFKVGDKVRTTNAWPWQNIHKGDTGVVTERVTEHSWPVVTVKFDRTGNSDDVADDHLELVEEKMKAVLVVEGPRGTTESLSENAVQALVAAGILYHNRTNVFDDRLVKYYGISPYRYTVTDKRSTYKSLEEQFPKDN